MNIYSIKYVIFLVVVLALFCLTPSKYRKSVLAIGSVVFYGIVDPILLWYMVIMISVISYCTKIHFEKNKDGNLNYIMTGGIIISLAILMIFKYTTGVFNMFSLGDNSIAKYLGILYPIGISYVSFQAIGYLIDLKYEKIEEKPSVIDISLYLFLFPKVLSGPIERAYEFLPQLDSLKVKADNFREGMIMIAWGCFKKLVIADKLGIAVDNLYANAANFTTFETFLVSLFYSIQVYTDFSAYSDIALGSCKIFDIKITQNFRSPFFSTSISDFWRRWHISLGNWFNEYYYTEVSMRLRSYKIWGVYAALLSTFVLIGIWHGITSGFILFGLVHGLAIVYETITRKFRAKLFKPLPAFGNMTISIAFTFYFYFLSCVLFRSTSFAQSMEICKNTIIGTFSGLTLLTSPGKLINEIINFTTKVGYFKLDLAVIAISLFILIAIDMWKKKDDLVAFLDNRKTYFRWSFYYAIVILTLFFGSFNSVQTFIYNQF